MNRQDAAKLAPGDRISHASRTGVVILNISGYVIIQWDDGKTSAGSYRNCWMIEQVASAWPRRVAKQVWT